LFSIGGLDPPIQSNKYRACDSGWPAQGRPWWDIEDYLNLLL